MLFLLDLLRSISILERCVLSASRVAREKFCEWNLLGGTIYFGVNSLSCLSNAAWQWSRDLLPIGW